MRFVPAFVFSLVLAGFCLAVAPISSTSWEPGKAGCLHFICPSVSVREVTEICPNSAIYSGLDQSMLESALGCVYAGYCAKGTAGCDCCSGQQVAAAAPSSTPPQLPPAVTVSAKKTVWDEYGVWAVFALALVAVAYFVMTGARDR